jgi:hypothetical protein
MVRRFSSLSGGAASSARWTALVILASLLSASTVLRRLRLQRELPSGPRRSVGLAHHNTGR